MGHLIQLEIVRPKPPDMARLVRFAERNGYNTPRLPLNEEQERALLLFVVKKLMTAQYCEA